VGNPEFTVDQVEPLSIDLRTPPPTDATYKVPVARGSTAAVAHTPGAPGPIFAQP